MDKNINISKAVLGSVAAGMAGAGNVSAAPVADVEGPAGGRAHSGKVFVAVHAHLDDVPRYCGGTVAKLLKEGYTGYLVRTTNDEKIGGLTNANNVLVHEQEHLNMAKALGFKDVFELYTREHRTDDISPIEIRGRLIFIFRYLKADTVISYNPRMNCKDDDRLFAGKAVEEACIMSGMDNDFPEFKEGGVYPYPVGERYCFSTNPNDAFNRVVDIGATVEAKISALAECKIRGGGVKGAELRKQLARQGKRLPILGNDDTTANREYIRNFVMKPSSTFDGIVNYGMEYAERFLYFDDRKAGEDMAVEEYIKTNAVNL
ncbi:PIG-L deacetylase family protein [Candidatus Latescibacterota bacterium]